MPIFVKAYNRNGVHVSAYTKKGGKDKGSVVRRRNRVKVLKSKITFSGRHQELRMKLIRLEDTLTKEIRSGNGAPQRAFSTGRRSKRWYS